MALVPRAIFSTYKPVFCNTLSSATRQLFQREKKKNMHFFRQCSSSFLLMNIWLPPQPTFYIGISAQRVVGKLVVWKVLGDSNAFLIDDDDALTSHRSSCLCCTKDCHVDDVGIFPLQKKIVLINFNAQCFVTLQELIGILKKSKPRGGIKKLHMCTSGPWELLNPESFSVAFRSHWTRF